MSIRSRPRVFISLLLLAAGFGLGWYLRPTVVSSVTHKAAPSAQTDRSSTPAAARSEKEVTPVAEPSLAGPETPSWAQRRKTLLWLQDVGVPMRLAAFQGREPGKALGKFLELTPAEMTAIQSAIRDTGKELDSLRAQKTTSRLNEDGTQWVVEIPAIDAATSGTLYDTFHGTLRATLGEERYALLNMVAGESLERGYDRYGLNEVRYEINLQPKGDPAKGDPVYEYRRHTKEATGLATGMTGGATPMAMLTKQDPLLERFPPPTPEAEGTK